ncbi:hypothetical protein LTS18_014411 [Coniosporium uncinatum]|uniref:Uncharacterized protein n=1 Tax=Coniosporium uncinatum TaxID=93489 RepID=A0ACC3CVW7_9PEZI|nr:hypothetical protein LTS18_014411 [Coniosporium uncinatum]
MKDEAALGRERTSQNPDNLTPACRQDPNNAPPYSSSQISETAKYREVVNIYNLASPETKPFYDAGVYQDGTNWDNWVIRWLLWHVFRYRDDRNRNRGPGRAERGAPPAQVQPPYQGYYQPSGMSLRSYAK